MKLRPYFSQPSFLEFGSAIAAALLVGRPVESGDAPKHQSSIIWKKQHWHRPQVFDIGKPWKTRTEGTTGRNNRRVLLEGANWRNHWEETCKEFADGRNGGNEWREPTDGSALGKRRTQPVEGTTAEDRWREPRARLYGGRQWKKPLKGTT